jgi:hypothetical protein
MYLLTRHAHSVGQEEISPGSRSVAEWGCVDLVWPSALRIARSCSTEEPSDPLVFRFVAAGGCRANGAALWSTDDQPRLAYSCGRGRPPQWSMQRGGCRRPSRRSSSRDSALVSAVARTSGSARARVRLRHGHDGRCDVRPARSSATRAHSAGARSGGSDLGYFQAIGSILLRDGARLTFTSPVPAGMVLVLGLTQKAPLQHGEAAFILPHTRKGSATVRIGGTPPDVSLQLPDGRYVTPVAAHFAWLTWPDGTRVTLSQYLSLFTTSGSSPASSRTH